MSEFTNEILENIWKDRYRKNNESFEDNLRRVANYCGKTDDEKKDFYNIMNKRFFFPAGRTMSNSGIGRSLTLNNCFVAPQLSDDLTDIFQKVELGAKTHQRGGGIGYDFSQLRPNGSPTSNDAIASGAVSFMDVFNAQTATILQGGRRGANMGVMNVYNMDIEEFINAKSYDEGKLNHFNVSVMVDDNFMKAVENNEDVFLHYPVYNEDGSICNDSSKWKYSKKQNAKELWDLIIKKAYDNGEPGIFFYDNLNKDNNLWYIENIVCSNPCVTGDTVILTDDGYKRIDSLVDKEVDVWNGYEYSTVMPRVTGHNQDMAKINFSDGSELKCTLYHKFILSDDSRVEARDLKVGDKLAKHSFPIIEGTVELSEMGAYTYGMFCGDGSVQNEKTNYNILPLYGEKKNLLPYINYKKINDQEENQNRLVAVLESVEYNKSFVPNNKYTISTRLNWLAGLIDSDGCLNSEDGAIVIASVNKPFLHDVKYMLNTLGTTGTISINHESGMRELPNGLGGTKEYATQDCYRLIINASNVKKLMDLGLNTHRVKLVANPNRDASRFIQITSIEFLDEKEDTVYCFTEEKNHSGIFNGVMTAQCAEYLSGTVYGNNPTNGEMLHKQDFGGACNLGSLFLHNFVENPFMEDAYFHYDNLLYAIFNAVNFLDSVIDINSFPDKIYENYQKSFRTIGLGITGLGDALVMMNMKYNSDDAIKFVDELMNFIAKNTYRASIDLAKKKGQFPFLNREKFVQSGFIQKHIEDDKEWKEIKDDILKYGIRNGKMLSVAPCGTLSLTYGNNCSSGLEPIFSLEYDRKVKMGGQSDKDIKIVKMQDYAYGLWKQMKELDKDVVVSEDKFVTAMNMTVEEHIKMLSTIAYHIDMSCSKTINVPTSYSFEETKGIYESCYNLGVKGCTIFRPNDIRQGILISSENKEIVKKEDTIIPRGVIIKADDNCVGRKRTLYTGCGTLHCEAFFDPINGNLLETYFSKGSSGGCNNFMIGLSRMISLASRAGVDIYTIVDQLDSCGTCPSYAVRRATKHDTSKGSCCPVAIGNALLDMYNEVHNDIFELEYDIEQRVDVVTEPKKKDLEHVNVKSKTACPECGEELTFEGGCMTCKSCGWTKCE